MRVENQHRELTRSIADGVAQECATNPPLLKIGMNSQARQLALTDAIGADGAVADHLPLPPSHLHTPTHQQLKEIAATKVPERVKSCRIQNGQFIQLRRRKRREGDIW